MLPDVCKKGVAIRKGMDEALKRHKEYDKLVAVSLDRFGDNTTTYQYAIKFRNKGIGLVAIEENVDSAEDWEGFVKKLDAGVDFQKRDEIRKLRTTKGRVMKIARMIKEGRKPSLKPAFGLKHKSDSTIVEVREIFELYLYEHKSTGEIAKEMNKGVIKSPEGKEWTAPTIHNILRNEAYTEVAQSLGYAPIKKYEFERVQKRLSMIKGGYGKNVLSKIVYCKECNEPLYLRSGKYYCKECDLKWDRKMLEAYVYVAVGEQFEEALDGIYERHYCKECDFRMGKVESRLGTLDNMQKLTRNWTPIELGKKVLVSEEGVEVIGLSRKEAYRILEIVDYVGLAKERKEYSIKQ